MASRLLSPRNRRGSDGAKTLAQVVPLSDSHSGQLSPRESKDYNHPREKLASASSASFSSATFIPLHGKDAKPQKRRNLFIKAILGKGKGGGSGDMSPSSSPSSPRNEESDNANCSDCADNHARSVQLPDKLKGEGPLPSILRSRANALDGDKREQLFVELKADFPEALSDDAAGDVLESLVSRQILDAEEVLQALVAVLGEEEGGAFLALLSASKSPSPTPPAGKVLQFDEHVEYAGSDDGARLVGSSPLAANDQNAAITSNSKKEEEEIAKRGAVVTSSPPLSPLCREGGSGISGINMPRTDNLDAVCTQLDVESTQLHDKQEEGTDSTREILGRKREKEEEEYERKVLVGGLRQSSDWASPREHKLCSNSSMDLLQTRKDKRKAARISKSKLANLRVAEDEGDSVVARGSLTERSGSSQTRRSTSVSRPQDALPPPIYISRVSGVDKKLSKSSSSLGRKRRSMSVSSIIKSSAEFIDEEEDGSVLRKLMTMSPPPALSPRSQYSAEVTMEMQKALPPPLVMPGTSPLVGPAVNKQMMRVGDTSQTWELLNQLTEQEVYRVMDRLHVDYPPGLSKTMSISLLRKLVEKKVLRFSNVLRVAGVRDFLDDPLSVASSPSPANYMQVNSRGENEARTAVLKTELVHSSPMESDRNFMEHIGGSSQHMSQSATPFPGYREHEGASGSSGTAEDILQGVAMADAAREKELLWKQFRNLDRTSMLHILDLLQVDYLPSMSKQTLVKLVSNLNARAVVTDEDLRTAIDVHLGAAVEKSKPMSKIIFGNRKSMAILDLDLSMMAATEGVDGSPRESVISPRSMNEVVSQLSDKSGAEAEGSESRRERVGIERSKRTGGGKDFDDAYMLRRNRSKDISPVALGELKTKWKYSSSRLLPGAHTVVQVVRKEKLQTAIEKQNEVAVAEGDDTKMKEKEEKKKKELVTLERSLQLLSVNSEKTTNVSFKRCELRQAEVNLLASVVLPMNRTLIVLNLSMFAVASPQKDIHLLCSSMKLCTSLRILDISSNQLSTLPDLANLAHLSALNASNNSITALPTSIGKMSALKVLDVSVNKITIIPPELHSLSATLRDFNISYNRLSSLPPSFHTMGALQLVSIKGNPIKSIPRAIRNGDGAVLMSYLKDLYAGTTQWHALRVMIVGQGNVGKTSLVRSLHAKKGKPPKSRKVRNVATDGIDISQFKMKSPGEESSLEVCLWDFAGQEVYYNTHQFFLSSRAVYLVVYDYSNFSSSRVEYWLQSIITYAETAPVILVGTHIDMKFCTEALMKTVKGAISNKFRKFKNIVCLSSVSTKTGKGVDELRDMIVKVAIDRKFVPLEIPTRYLALGTRLKSMKAATASPTLGWGAYKAAAEECGVTGKSILAATEFYHDMGEILYFPDVSPDVVIIDPQWITKMFATIVTVKSNFVHNGILDESALPFLWRQYKEDMWPFMLRLLTSFETVFRIGDGKVFTLSSMLAIVLDGSGGGGGSGDYYYCHL